MSYPIGEKEPPMFCCPDWPNCKCTPDMNEALKTFSDCSNELQAVTTNCDSLKAPAKTPEPVIPKIRYMKKRNRMTHLTPPKKKRK